MSVGEIAYPVILFTHTGVAKCDADVQNKKASYLGFSRGYCHGYRFIDAELRRYHIASAEIDGDNNLRFPILTRWWRYFANPVVSVRLSIRLEPGLVTLDSVKQDVVQSLRRDFTAFGNDYIQSLIQRAKSATSVSAIAKVIP